MVVCMRGRPLASHGSDWLGHLLRPPPHQCSERTMVTPVPGLPDEAEHLVHLRRRDMRWLWGFLSTAALATSAAAMQRPMHQDVPTAHAAVLCPVWNESECLLRNETRRVSLHPGRIDRLARSPKMAILGELLSLLAACMLQIRN